MFEPVKKEEHPMWRDINASLAEKIKTLKENPFRFYVAENIWVPRQNRIKLLKDHLEEAIDDEDYELCRTIHELIVFLTALYDKDNNYYKIFLLATIETRYELQIKYFLIKSENKFNIYAEVDDCTELYDHNVFIECSVNLSVTELNDVLFKLFRYNELFHGFPI